MDLPPYSVKRPSPGTPLSHQELQNIQRKESLHTRLAREALLEMRHLHALSAIGLCQPQTYIQKLRDLDPRDRSWEIPTFFLPNFTDLPPLPGP